jgi:hypothetical protein
MLKEFIEQQEYPQPQSPGESYREIIAACNNCVDFLKDPRRFPNPEINKVTTLMWELVGNKHIYPVLDQWNFPSLVFMAFKMEYQQLPIIVVPADFVDQVQQNPIAQLGIISYTASQCRDFYCSRFVDHDSQDIDARSTAYRIETFLTIERMAAAEDVGIEFSPQDYMDLVKYPDGLKSLPPRLMYSTPVYQAPPSFNAN